MSVIIRLQNLPLTAGPSDVRAFFTGLKIPEGAVHIVGGVEGDSFIGFASDEDARQAMRRDRGRIHQTEVRLYLSSRTEMMSIIEQAKAGTLNDGLASPPPSKPEIADPWTVPIRPEPAYPLPGSNGHHNPAFGVTDTNDQVKNLYTRAAVAPAITAMPDVGGGLFQKLQPPSQQPPMQHLEVQGPPKDNYRGGYMVSGGIRTKLKTGESVQGKFASPNSTLVAQKAAPVAEPPLRFFNNGPPALNAHRPLMPPPVPVPVVPKYSQVDTESLLSTPKIEDPFAALPPHLRPPHGIPPPHLRNLAAFQPKEPVTNGPTRKQPEFKPRVANEIEPESWKAKGLDRAVVEERTFPPQTAQLQDSWREPAFPPRKAPFLADRDRRPTNGPSNSNGPPSREPSRRPPLSDSNVSNFTRKPAHQPDSRRQEEHQPRGMGYGYGAREHPPSRSLLGGPPAYKEKRFEDENMKYVEISRLPNELLRPSALEEFMKPSVRLSLSSVKVVYGPGGIHIHTLVHFDNIQDAAAMISRDGEMGIKVRKSTKRDFDDAVDGVPPAVIQPFGSDVEMNGRESLSPRDGSRRRSATDSRRRERRVKSRSRSNERRRRRRSRSRSPIRNHKDPNRWCLQLTNVPFKIKEEELMEWFSERVKPSKLNRAYYADGNASDRWVAEFESESLMQRAKGIRTLCKGRTLKMAYVENDFADEILKIEDSYGEHRKAQWEEEHGPSIPPPSTSQPPSFGRMPVILPPFPMPPMRGMPPRGGGGPPMRGRGGRPPPSFGPPGMGSPPTDFNGNFRGRGRGAFVANRGPRGGGRFGSRGPTDELMDTQQDTGNELASSLGAKGTVIVCQGFPTDITLEDVMNFFAGHNADGNSVRMRMGDDGVPTGECMLSVRDPEVQSPAKKVGDNTSDLQSARRAVQTLNGKGLRGRFVSLIIAA